MDHNTKHSKSGSPPGIAAVYAYTLIATVYCSAFCLLYYFIAKKTGVLWSAAILNAVACIMVFITCNYFLKQSIIRKEAVEEQVRIKTMELTRNAANLAASNAELEQFAYVASHDLQEPLNTTTGFVKLLKQKYEGRLDKEADQYLHFIEQACERMKTLITGLLDYSRTGIHKELQQVDCNQLLADVLADLNYIIQKNEAVIHADQLPRLNGNATDLKLLFQNLISNAIKFRKQDCNPEIQIRVEQKAGYWQFSFTDNGIGMHPQFHATIFGLFKRLHTRDQYEGSGIGLARCKKIAELHGGKIWVDSAPGQGSTFYFTIQEM
jgi:light-regulated signal transduction histidine kinase (bacteriophytochrome)